MKIDLGDATFIVPDGWDGEGDTSGAALVPSDGTAANNQELVAVFVSDSEGVDARAQADRIAERTSGAVSQLSNGLDGETAYRVSSPKSDVLAEEWIVVQHSGKNYVISGDSTEHTDIWPLLRQISESWTWR